MSRELKDSFLIPAKIVRELVKFNIVKYRFVCSMIHFKTSDGVFVSSILHADKYYEVSEHFKFSGETVNFPKEMRKVMPTIAVMVEAEELSAEPQYIDVEISKDGIICESSKDLGSVRSEFKCKTKLKKSTSFKIKPEVLEKILDHTSRVKIGKAKALFEIDNFRHLAALVK